MKTHEACISCFFRQAREAARLAGANEEQQEEIVAALNLKFASYSLAMSPPEVARDVYGLVREQLSFVGDIYAEVKSKSNQLALSIYGDLKQKVAKADGPLLMATELAIVGNVIDYGAKNGLDIDAEIKKIVAKESQQNKRHKNLFDYEKFKETINTASTILYLGDNAGETVFDRILIEEIKRLDENKKVIYVVKDSPIINDATAKDACECGIDKVADIISSGSDAPGTVLSLCSDEFKQLFNSADMVISKGQGNFEALSDEERPIFFLFMIKCPVVAAEIPGDIGELVLSFR